MNDRIELTIQRLIDRELGDEQRAELLRLAETHPELWRQMALAFVEDDVWSSVVTGSQAADFESPLKCVAGTEKLADLRSRPWWRRHGSQLLMTAAAVLFAFTVALRFNPAESRDRIAPTGQADLAQIAPVTPVNPNSGPAGSTLAVNQPWQLKVNDQVQVPLYENFEQMRVEFEKRNSELDPATLRYFLEAGYHVQPDIRYFTGNSEDGRSFIVPVQSYRVRRYRQ